MNDTVKSNMQIILFNRYTNKIQLQLHLDLPACSRRQETEIKHISVEKRAAGEKNWQPQHHLWADCLDCWILNISQTNRPLRPVKGTALLILPCLLVMLSKCYWNPYLLRTYIHNKTIRGYTTSKEKITNYVTNFIGLRKTEEAASFAIPH